MHNILEDLNKLLEIKIFDKKNVNNNFFDILKSFKFIFNKSKLRYLEQDNINDLIYLVKENTFMKADKYLEIINNNTIKTKIYYYDNIRINIFEINKKKIDIKLIIECVKIIEFIAKNIYNKNTDLEVNINLFLTDEKKIFTNTKILNSDNINSGVTLINEYVFIWRYEEVYKVLIHELIHFYDITMKDKNIKQDITFCFEGRNSVNEAITESLAILVYSFIIAKNNNMPLDKKINSEIVFNFFQVNKILTFFDIANLEELFIDSCKNKIHQDTSIVSYFIIKIILLNNFEEFINFIFNLSYDSYKDFIKLFKSSLKKKDLQENLDKTNIFNLTRKDLLSDNLLFNTLRMSFYSIIKQYK